MFKSVVQLSPADVQVVILWDRQMCDYTLGLIFFDVTLCDTNETVISLGRH